MVTDRMRSHGGSANIKTGTQLRVLVHLKPPPQTRPVGCIDVIKMVGVYFYARQRVSRASFTVKSSADLVLARLRSRMGYQETKRSSGTYAPPSNMHRGNGHCERQTEYTTQNGKCATICWTRSCMHAPPPTCGKTRSKSVRGDAMEQLKIYDTNQAHRIR